MIVKRDLYKEIKPYFKAKEAIIVTGMRRVGKTTLLQLISDEIKTENKLFLDLENPLNQRYFTGDDFEQIKITLETLGLDFNKKVYLFLDEIQLVKNIPQIVKYFIDHYDVKFFLTGSASFYLKNIFSESLAGRKYIFELFPFSFKEFLTLKNIKLKIPNKHSEITESIFSLINRYYKEYLQFGGFPQVINKKTIKEKQKTLNDIFTSYFQSEVKQLSDFKKTDKLRDLILLLTERVGNRIDVSKLSQELAISRDTINDYLGFLEGTYFIKMVRPFSRNKDIEIRKSSKVYLCDSGLLNILTSIDQGSLFEQNVFQILRQKGELNYYQKKTGAEIDFILDKKKAYEVKVSPRQSDMHKIIKLSKELGLTANIVSMSYSDLKKIVYIFEL